MIGFRSNSDEFLLVFLSQQAKAKPAHGSWPVQAKGPEHDGRVAGRAQLLRLGPQAPPEFPEIVDLAVEDDDVSGRRVHLGLTRRGYGSSSRPIIPAIPHTDEVS